MLSQATIKVNFKGNMKDTLFKCNKNLTFKNQLLFSGPDVERQFWNPLKLHLDN